MSWMGLLRGPLFDPYQVLTTDEGIDDRSEAHSKLAKKTGSGSLTVV